MKREKLTLEQHLKIAKDLETAATLILQVLLAVQPTVNLGSKVMTGLNKLNAFNGCEPWVSLLSELDKMYYDTITEDEFKKHGWIYYGWRLDTATD